MELESLANQADATLAEDPPRDPFEDFEDSDPDRARRCYQLLVTKLRFYFSSRGCADTAEDLAQEVIARAFFKRSEGALIYTELLRYCYGIAANCLKEGWRSPAEADLTETAGVPADPPPPGELNQSEQQILLEECLSTLPQEEREILWEYYQGDRKALAVKLGMSENALRIRVFRILKKLRQLHGKGARSSAAGA